MYELIMRIEPLNELLVQVEEPEGFYYMLWNPFKGWYIFSMDEDWNETLPFSSLNN